MCPSPGQTLPKSLVSFFSKDQSPLEQVQAPLVRGDHSAWSQ